MKKFNLIVVFNISLNKVLFCIRAKEPYKGLYNFVGGKVEEGKTNDEAAYRELFEETGISNKDIELDHFMDLNYFKYSSSNSVYSFFTFTLFISIFIVVLLQITIYVFIFFQIN